MLMCFHRDHFATLTKASPRCREDRYAFIRAKYVERRFALHSTSDPYELLQDVELAVSTRHLYQLLAAFAEGADLTAPITGSQLRETALHLAVRQVWPLTSCRAGDVVKWIGLGPRGILVRRL